MPQAAPILVPHRQFSGLALKGGPESFLFVSLTWGSVAPPHPLQSSDPLGPPPLVVLAGLMFVGDTHRQFSGLAPYRGGPESFLFGHLPLVPALVGRRAEALLSSFVVTAFSCLALSGRPGELVPPLSQGGGKQSFPPLELGLACLPVGGGTA